MKKIKNRSIFILLTIILSLGITLGAVYYMYQYKDSRENQLKTSMISLNFTEKSEVINLTSNVPMIDDLGLKGTPYEFSITNTSTVPIKANIKLDVDNDTTIKYGAVRYALFIDDERVIKDYVHRDNLTLYEVSELKPNEVINCKLYFWIDYYYDYPGEIFKAKIKAVGESIDKLQQEAITVTFDADGGVLDTTTKEVYYHGYYGELPTPTKEGYTFMGWNGKNLINAYDREQQQKNGLTIYVKDGVFYIYGTNTQNNDEYVILTYNNDNNDFPLLQKNERYTISVSNHIPGIYIQSNYLYQENKQAAFFRLCDRYEQTYSSHTFIVYNDYIKTRSFFVGIWHQSSSINGNFKVQLEKGEQATEYEPYYITSYTKVVQNGNHTLKAIWKENS